jgi:hypothetical protein
MAPGSLPMKFVLVTLTGNGMNIPTISAYDGEPILLTNDFGNRVSLWRVADLTPFGIFSTGAIGQPYGGCSDGLKFWVTMRQL